MATKFATLNVGLSDYCKPYEAILDIENFLNDAAIDSFIESHHFFYDQESDVFGMQMPVDEGDISEVLWAGGFLGICYSGLENSAHIPIEKLWISMESVDKNSLSN